MKWPHSHRLILLPAVIFLAVAGVPFAHGAAGDLDPSFNKTGTVVTPLSADNDWIDDIAVQPDGKIVAVGHMGQTSSGDAVSMFAVVRFLSDGRLDPSFGSGGVVVTTSFSDPFAFARSVALQPDGKIVVCGDAQTVVGSVRGFTHVVVVRYLADGRLDPSFSGDGVVEAGRGSPSSAKSVKVQPDGKIVVAGSAAQDVMVLRYTPDGSPDRRFGLHGRVIISNSPSTRGGEAQAVVLQPDQKLLLAGYYGNQNTMFAARLQPYGKIDASFDGDGRQQISFGTGSNIIYDCEVQPDGKVLLAGNFAGGSAAGDAWAVVRLNPDGSFDQTFDGDGKLAITAGGWISFLPAIELQPDGKIILGGTVQEFMPDDYNFLVMRRNPDGSPDTSFGTNGQSETSISPLADQIRTLKLQPDGKIVAAGFAVSPDRHTRFALARYLAN